LLQEIIDLVPLVYSPPKDMPFEAKSPASFLADKPETPAQIITGIRMLIEENINTNTE
jgi:hypothetical protein